MTHCNVFSVDILIFSVKENHKSTQFTIKCTVVSLNQNIKKKSFSLMCHEEVNKLLSSLLKKSLFQLKI